MPCEYPLFIDLTNRLTVVVGAGNVAARKVDKLLSAGARVRVVAREIAERVESLVAGGTGSLSASVSAANTGRQAARATQLELVRENFRPDHVKGAFLVFACTDNPEVNAEVAKAARAAGALVNRADAPDDCDFFVPAVSEHGPVKLAISTGGASPALAKFIRRQLDEHLPPGLGELAGELAEARSMVQKRVARPEDRAAIWETLCGEESIRRLTDEGMDAWRQWFEQVVSTAGQGS